MVYYISVRNICQWCTKTSEAVFVVLSSKFYVLSFLSIDIGLKNLEVILLGIKKENSNVCTCYSLAYNLNYSKKVFFEYKSI